MKHMVTVFAVAAVLPQGGFTDAVWSLCGIFAAVYLAFKGKNCLPAPIMAIMPAAIIIYAGSALYHGLPFESLAVVGRLMVICLLLLSFHNMDADVRETAFVAGMVVAAIGFAAFCGVLSWPGAVASRRLQSVFQYSNAAGLYLGVAAFLTRRHPKRSPYAIFLETALVLTQSTGALLVYAAGWAIYILKNREVRVAPVVLSLAASFLSAGIIYAIVYYLAVPQLAILIPAALIAFRNKLSNLLQKAPDTKWALFAGCAGGLAAVAAMLITRGLRPLGTYLERLIQISDGAAVIARYPLGIGPGAWQFFYRAHQSAPYEATVLHCGYIGAGVDAGFLAVIAIVLFALYWLRRQSWDDKCVCVLIVLLHVFMDISFSFLSIVLITAMLISDTLPKKPGAKPVPLPFRGLLVIPLALLTVVFASSAVKNSAEWAADSGDATAAALLERRLVHNDTGAFLMQMRVGLQTGDHGGLDHAFASMAAPNAEANAIKARSLIERGSYTRAAEYSLAAAELSPHSPAGFMLLEEAVSHLDSEERAAYREKIFRLETETRQNPLFAYIQRLEGG